MIQHLTLRSLLLLAAVSCSALVLAHPAGEEGHDDHPEQTVRAVQGPKGIVLPNIDGPKPWSDKPVLDDPQRFQIAIMTDRTGGHRPGVWMKAVNSINLLRPDFVMSVGDLIEGYTNDEATAQAEWKEFTSFIDKLDMKFFFVAGNHDVTNPLLHRIWRERFGPVWYSFDYKDVHFVCLCSEDPNFRIGDEQLAWLEKDLEKSKDSRWTLVFVHKPLWQISERYISFGIRDRTNWNPVADLLRDRPHTVFAGHTHHYAQYNRNGTKFYQLATTGGGSQLRGVPYGEFDHIMWLTMENDGPRVTNLLLDGIVGGDEVNEDSLKRFRNFLAKAKVEVAPILIEEGNGLSQGRIDIRLTNEFDAPVTVSGTIEGLPLRGLTVDPVELELTAAPGETHTLSVDVHFTEEIPFADLAETIFRTSMKTIEDKPLAAKQIVPVVIDRRFTARRLSPAVTVDGDLSEWGKLSHATPNPPLQIGPAEQWQGAGDASFTFDIAHDDEHLYLAARVTDDRVLKKGDKLQWILDTRSIAKRSSEPALGWGVHFLTLEAKDRSGKIKLRSIGERKYEGTATVRRTDGGYLVEAALPIAVLTDQQGDDWHSLQSTVVIQDVDDAAEQPIGIAWRGTQLLNKRNENFGHFVRDETE